MPATMQDATKAVWAACSEIVGNEGVALDENASFFDLGFDSLGLAELVVQLEELYGDGVITIDDVLANPVVCEVAAKLSGGSATGALKKAPDKLTSPAAVSEATTKATANAPTPKTSTVPALVKPPPDYITTTPKTSEMMGPAALIVERLEKLESGSRELREMVLQLSVVTPIPIERLGDDAAEALATSEAVVTDEGTALPPGPESDWIRTTHVGALPRDTGDEEVELCASALIARQRAAGISIINDGEWSRESFADVLSRVKGIGFVGGGKCELPVAEDLRAVPTYSKRFTPRDSSIVSLNPKRIATADQACTELTLTLTLT